LKSSFIHQSAQSSHQSRSTHQFGQYVFVVNGEISPEVI
jgi:hypothetical protein